MNCCVSPFAIDGFAGVTAIETSVAGVTVSTVDPVIEPDVALMVLVPTARAVVNPPVAMVAVPAVPDAQVTVLVRFDVLLSV